MSGPLEGVTVLDLSRFIAGPFCAQMLGDMGAKVIKVERPGGEDARHHEPFFKGASVYTMIFNRNKHAITLNTRHKAAREILESLVRQSDVLVENFRPGTLAEMGFSYERLQELNPRLVVTSISGFGQTGPLAQRALFDADRASDVRPDEPDRQRRAYANGNFHRRLRSRLAWRHRNASCAPTPGKIRPWAGRRRRVA